MNQTDIERYIQSFVPPRCMAVRCTEWATHKTREYFSAFKKNYDFKLFLCDDHYTVYQNRTRTLMYYTLHDRISRLADRWTVIYPLKEPRGRMDFIRL